MGYYMRYFADASLALDALKAELAAQDRTFKIDGGELLRGGELLAEIEINRPGSDLFGDELAQMTRQLQATGDPAAQHVLAQVQATQSLIAVQVMDQSRSPELTMELLAPFWTALQRLANGLWHVAGQGFFENGKLLVAV